MKKVAKVVISSKTTKSCEKEERIFGKGLSLIPRVAMGSLELLEAEGWLQATGHDATFPTEGAILPYLGRVPPGGPM